MTITTAQPMVFSSLEHMPFTPNGLNDKYRIDFSRGEPFLAVDDNPHERDDAFRIRSLRDGGFCVQIAIADGSQLSDRTDIVNRALTRGDSTYHWPGKHHMLPQSVRRQLELTASHERQRATIVESTFGDDGYVTGISFIYSAYISVREMSYAYLSRQYIRVNGGLDSPIPRFLTGIRQAHQRPPVYPISLGGNRSNHAYSHEVIQTLMEHANDVVPTFMAAKGIPMPEKPKISAPLRRKNDLLAHITLAAIDL